MGIIGRINMGNGATTKGVGMKKNPFTRALCVCLCFSLVSLVSPGSIETLANKAPLQPKGASMMSPSNSMPAGRVRNLERLALVDEIIGTPDRQLSDSPNGQQSSLMLDLSFNIGPIAAQLDITRVVEQPSGAFFSTLHEHIRDDTQIPAFNGDLVATGRAPDPDTLLGVLLPAALIVKQDLLAGMTFQQAAADAQAKTGVTVTFFNDPTAVEYAVMLALIIVVCITGIARVQPGLRDDACMIRAKLEAGLAALGFQNPPDVCVATQ